MRYLSRRVARPAWVVLVHQVARAHSILSMIAPTDAFFVFQKPALVNSNSRLLPDLENLIKASNFGVDASNQQEVKDLMVAISDSRMGDQRASLPGKWELIYTTEKEINCKGAQCQINSQYFLMKEFPHSCLCRNGSFSVILAFCRGVVNNSKP
jgi:hypothetical protein